MPFRPRGVLDVETGQRPISLIAHVDETGKVRASIRLPHWQKIL